MNVVNSCNKRFLSLIQTGVFDGGGRPFTILTTCLWNVVPSNIALEANQVWQMFKEAMFDHFKDRSFHLISFHFR